MLSRSYDDSSAAPSNLWEALRPWWITPPSPLDSDSAAPRIYNLALPLYETLTYCLDPRAVYTSRPHRAHLWTCLTPEAQAQILVAFELGGTEASVACFESYVAHLYPAK